MFSSLSQAETLLFMQKAEKAFEGVPQDEITDRDKSLWSLYVLMLTVAESARKQNVVKAFNKATYTGVPTDKPLTDEELKQRTKTPTED